MRFLALLQAKYLLSNIKNFKSMKSKKLLQAVLVFIFALSFSVVQAQSVQKKTLSKAESQKLKRIDYKASSTSLQTPAQIREKLVEKIKLQVVDSPAHLKLKAKLEELDRAAAKKKLEDQ